MRKGLLEIEGQERLKEIGDQEERVGSREREQVPKTVLRVYCILFYGIYCTGRS